MKKLTIALITFILLALAIWTYSTDKNHTGDCTATPAGLICGEAWNDPHSATPIQTGTDWNGTEPTGTIITLLPGENSNGTLIDADAIHIPENHCGRFAGLPVAEGGEWTKIIDGRHYITVTEGNC